MLFFAALKTVRGDVVLAGRRGVVLWWMSGKPFRYGRNAIRIRLIILNKILPAPAESVKPVLLAEFKDRHGKLLNAFKREIEEQVLRLAVVPPEDLRFAMSMATGILQGGVEDITEQLNQTGFT